MIENKISCRSRRFRAGLFLLASCALAITAVAPALAGPISYTVTDLGTLGGTRTTSTGISSNGVFVTGSSSLGSPTHAFVYSGGGMTDLGTLGGTSIGYAVNNSGQVAGSSNSHAFLYSGGVLQDLGTLTGAGFSLAYGINDSGTVVGYSNFVGGDSHSYHAFEYSGGVMTDLGGLGGTSSYAAAINDAGVIAGYLTPNSASTEAFVDNGGVVTLLGTLGGLSSNAAGISSNGYVAGSSNISNGNTDAFLYAGGVLIDLGTLGGSTSRASGVNNLGDVVGESLYIGSGFHGFIYESGQLLDLNSLIDPSLGITITDATGISDTGAIDATGTTANGQSHSFLLSPKLAAPVMGVPESPTLPLLGAGMVGAMVMGRRKAKKTGDLPAGA